MVRGDILSWLGFSLGSSVQAVSDYFLDAAFVGSQVLRAFHATLRAVKRARESRLQFSLPLLTTRAI